MYCIGSIRVVIARVVMGIKTHGLKGVPWHAQNIASDNQVQLLACTSGLLLARWTCFLTNSRRGEGGSVAP